MTRLQREHFGPFVLAILAAIAMKLALDAKLINAPLASAGYPAALLSLGGVLLGFMATLKTLLYGMQEKTRQRLTDSGYIKDLIQYLSAALWGSLAMCIAALVSFFVSDSSLMHAVLCGATVFALASVARITSIGTKLLALK